MNPELIMVRMPAFGLTGPWRKNTEFAQTMESITGMAWLTGFADGPPVLVRERLRSAGRHARRDRHGAGARAATATVAGASSSR